LNLKIAGALRQFEHSTVHSVELLADSPQVLEDQIFRFSHHRSLAQILFHCEQCHAASPANCA
jgi:hypothetical protein